MKKSKTKSQITRSEALAFRRRWKTVNDFVKGELCNTSVDEKLGQLILLMTSAKELGWTKAQEVEANEVRARWNKLRRVYDV